MAPTETELTPDASASTTSVKRKIDDAFDALDDALQPKDRPTPSKRANTSIYGTLAKYGIGSLTKPSTVNLPSTPTLSRLLSRSRSKKQRKPLIAAQTWKDASSSATPEYTPSSTEAFLQRLSTFSLATYPSKPSQIDAVAASKAGWVNEGGKDRLCCAICKVGWVVAGREGMSRDAGNALVEKQRKSLVEMHKEGCPWRVRQCDPLVYRIPLQSPTSLARQIKSHAAELEPVMDSIAIRHPLSSAQVQSLIQTVSSVSVPNARSTSPSDHDQSHPPLPSTNSILTSLFGWSLVAAPPPLPHKSSSASLALGRAHSRASSIVAPSRESTPAPFSTPSKSTTAESPTPSRGPPQQKDALLQCRMCQRRVGLWAFAAPAPTISLPHHQHEQPQASRPQRHFDILREHRSYCPYVVKSTPLPSVPSYPAAPSTPTPRSSFNLTRAGTSSSLTEGAQNPSTSTFNLRRTTSLLSGAGHVGTSSSAAPSAPVHTLVEGWRAVLSVVLRCGMAERSRVHALSPSSAPAPSSVADVPEKDEDDAMSGVIALVDGVKQHGGKQLLNYVRGLLG